MLNKINEIKNSAIDEINSSLNLKELNDVRVKYLGKSGKVTELMKGMRDVEASLRPQYGQLCNTLRTEIESALKSKESVLKEEEMAELGSLHPLTIVKNEIIDIFAGLGFEIFEGPEIEHDYYNFEALNTPKDHPARDMQDTFYITDEYLLRTQTSAGQIRVMEKKAPPIKILSPGRVYRSDSDATHSPMFHQMEGLVVDEKITLSDLKGILDMFAQKMFNKDTKTRLRPSYFPFTEPSVEVDVTCSECGGKGCKFCKGTGWIEILGAGMVNHKVLENCGIDSKKYSGFAFGLGLERITIIKYKIPNIKLLFENDIRFLKQFKQGV